MVVLKIFSSQLFVVTSSIDVTIFLAILQGLFMVGIIPF